MAKKFVDGKNQSISYLVCCWFLPLWFQLLIVCCFLFRLTKFLKYLKIFYFEFFSGTYVRRRDCNSKINRIEFRVVIVKAFKRVETVCYKCNGGPSITKHPLFFFSKKFKPKPNFNDFLQTDKQVLLPRHFDIIQKFPLYIGHIFFNSTRSESVHSSSSWAIPSSGIQGPELAEPKPI